MAAIEIDDLRVVRGGRVVLDGLDADVDAGRVTGLLGPSGSGKSTLMRAIVGVQIVAGGSVRVLGEPAGSAPLRRRVAYMTQAPSVYGDLTVRENLRYFARVLGVAGDRVDERSRPSGSRRDADRVVDRLSGGQRARASLATALLGEPGAARARRADRRPGSGAAARPVGRRSTSSPTAARRSSSRAT